MKPEEIRMFFRYVSQHANSLLTRYNQYLKHRNKVTFKEYQKPIVTVSRLISALKLYFYVVYSVQLDIILKKIYSGVFG